MVSLFILLLKLPHPLIIYLVNVIDLEKQVLNVLFELSLILFRRDLGWFATFFFLWRFHLNHNWMAAYLFHFNFQIIVTRVLLIKSIDVSMQAFNSFEDLDFLWLFLFIDLEVNWLMYCFCHLDFILWLVLVNFVLEVSLFYPVFDFELVDLEVVLVLLELSAWFWFHVFDVFCEIGSANRTVQWYFEPVLDAALMENMFSLLYSWCYSNLLILGLTIQLFQMLELIKLKAADATIFIEVIVRIFWPLIMNRFQMLAHIFLNFWDSKPTFAHLIWHNLFSIWLQNSSHFLSYFL